mmetsp:Transcript_10239/g.19650  ORF Transcript_10239/g.19650 Transcript_10239/m.19650 type:complete len:94 (-) Transcript_10239:202-483(-)|eukprot:scaffold3195_cov162-Amphora_coffeaeformis.AAC.8
MMTRRSSYLKFFSLLLLVFVRRVLGDKEPLAETAERISTTGGKVRAWDALYRMEYDIVLAVGVVMVILLLWLRALYLHLTVKPVPDKYKPKYH